MDRTPSEELYDAIVKFLKFNCAGADGVLLPQTIPNSAGVVVSELVAACMVVGAQATNRDNARDINRVSRDIDSAGDAFIEASFEIDVDF